MILNDEYMRDRCTIKLVHSVDCNSKVNTYKITGKPPETKTVTIRAEDITSFREKHGVAISSMKYETAAQGILTQHAAIGKPIRSEYAQDRYFPILRMNLEDDIMFSIKFGISIKYLDFLILCPVGQIPLLSIVTREEEEPYRLYDGSLMYKRIFGPNGQRSNEPGINYENCIMPLDPFMHLLRRTWAHIFRERTCEIIGLLEDVEIDRVSKSYA